MRKAVANMMKEYGYEYDAIRNEELWRRTKGRTTNEYFMGAMCFRSGRDTLKAIAREFKPTVALIPALACDSMVLPFEMYGHRIRYYKLNPDYSINLESLNSALNDVGKEALFLYMDYFGNSAINDNELNRLKTSYPDLIFIEDRTHNLLAERKSKFEPDFVMASLRKWMDIPDGGLLWPKGDLRNCDFSRDTSFSEKRLEAQCMMHEYLQTGHLKTKTCYRNIFSSVSSIIDTDTKPGLMSAYAFELAMSVDLASIRDIRNENAATLADELRRGGLSLINMPPGVCDLYVPLLTENRDNIQKKLSLIRIYCTVIWPLNSKQKELCEVAKRTQEHMLAIYCDQRYTKADMRYIASNIMRLCNE